jgi:hypothetical protein
MKFSTSHTLLVLEHGQFSGASMTFFCATSKQSAGRGYLVHMLPVALKS